MLASRIRRWLLLLYTRWYARLNGVTVGKGTIVRPGARLKVLHGGSIAIGEGCVFHRGSIVETFGGRIRIGNRVSLNSYSILYGHGGLDIGDDVLIASHVVVIPANHGILADVSIRSQPLSQLGIRIASDVWIGTGARILDGVAIPGGCVIAAGAVVIPGPLNANVIYGGVPARAISARKNRISA